MFSESGERRALAMKIGPPRTGWHEKGRVQSCLDAWRTGDKRGPHYICDGL